MREVRPTPVTVPTFTSAEYAEGIEHYLESGQAEKTLRPYQMEVFRDFQDFFAGDHRRGHVTMPTGTGKTVLFVELSKALLAVKNDKGESPRILVVDPLKDLVHQTLGDKNNPDRRQGYGGFAPELPVGTFFSDTHYKGKGLQEHLMSFPVVLSTYASLRKLYSGRLLRRLTLEELEDHHHMLVEDTVNSSKPGFNNFWAEYVRLMQGLENEEMIANEDKRLLNLFNVYIFDEAHHILGRSASNIVDDSLSDEAQIIGFTASPQSTPRRTIKKHLPKRIHNLELKEAVAMEMLAPLVALGISSNDRIFGHDIFDDSGDFIEERITYLAESERRNHLLVRIAKTMVENGVGTVVNCIAGNEAAHAKHIAQLLRAQGVAAEAIHYEMPSRDRIERYKAFEQGEIDVLTYIGILAEGWDSTRAKGLINGRPSRSRIVATQRLGRILRPGAPAFAIDVIDRLEDVNPTYSIADILHGEDIERSKVFGAVTPEEQSHIETLINALGRIGTLRTALRADHTRFDRIIANYPEIQKGELMDALLGTYRVATNLSRQFRGVTDDILEKIAERRGVKLSVRLGNHNSTLRKTYHVRDALKLLQGLPVSDPTQFYTDPEGQWIVAEGMETYFGQRYSDMNLAVAHRLVDRLKDDCNWQPVRSEQGHTRRNMWSQLHCAFLVDQKFIDTACAYLDNYFATEHVIDK